ncbi:MAG: hypothetical protein AVDCRST_MAG56-3202, partial [uncultured Cytophagales bacterium]
ALPPGQRFRRRAARPQPNPTLFWYPHRNVSGGLPHRYHQPPV